MKIQVIKEAIGRFARDEEGLTMVEYAVAGGLVTGAVVLSFTALGGEVKRIIDGIATALKAA